ncbi:MAG: DEAD/DEAH box helicase family protein, partial [Balneolales bacterium]|nr:DEAD/DEAH box helicase family protein [Balneolales bacterium]
MASFSPDTDKRTPEKSGKIDVTANQGGSNTAPPSGLYEQLITDLLAQRLETLPAGTYHIQPHPVEPLEAARYLTQHVSTILHYALSAIPSKDRPLGQIDLANKIIRLLAQAINDSDLNGDLVHTEGRLLEAVINRLDNPHADLKARIREIMPHTRLSQSELFTGNRAGVSLESEINKEIASSDEICWLVSFIKFSGIRTLMPALREFTRRGKLRIITTSYMGATDAKAVATLARLPNTEIKVSYNPEHERLHAKAYLFLRNSGFHTGYIGSSNLSRSALTNGLEWNMKITTREVAHIIDKFRKTFDTYWADNEFEPYDAAIDGERLQKALNQQRMRSLGKTGDQTGLGGTITTFFEVKPYPFQQEILDKLHAERTLHHRKRNLVVAATGTGKTVISAFDFKRYRAAHPEARLLFVAHRKEILQQAR